MKDVKEKQVVEMAKHVCKYAHEDCERTCYDSRICTSYSTCKRLYNAGYRKQSWISVEERLPSEKERRDKYGELVPFLVCEKDTEYPYRAFYDGTIWGDGFMKIKGITHWMPLPEPPKMRKEDEGK